MDTIVPITASSSRVIISSKAILSRSTDSSASLVTAGYFPLSICAKVFNGIDFNAFLIFSVF